VPIAVTTEQQAIAESVSQWARRADTIAAVRARETAQPEPWVSEAWRSPWAGLADLGVFAIGRPEELGGAGGTTADVAVVAEQLAAVLAPGPVTNWTAGARP
jgi:3-oxochol-4-en-24-oyl-CoA dehydrogenase